MKIDTVPPASAPTGLCLLRMRPLALLLLLLATASPACVGFPPLGPVTALGVRAYQLRLKDWARQDGGNPVDCSLLRSVRHSRDSEQDQSAHNPPGEESVVAVVSTLRIGTIHFASLIPFPAHLNTSSSSTTSVFTAHHFVLSPNFYDNFLPWFISNRIF